MIFVSYVMLISFMCLSFSTFSTIMPVSKRDQNLENIREHIHEHITEQILMPACLKLFSKEHITHKQFVTMFKEVSFLAEKYESCYKSLLGSIIDIIQNASFDIHAIDRHGNTVLHYAATQRLHILCDALVRMGSDPRQKNFVRKMPLDCVKKDSCIYRVMARAFWSGART